MKLNQVIAIEKGEKKRLESQLVAIHNMSKQEALFSGFHKSFQPLDEEGERFADESQTVAERAADNLFKVAETFREIMKIVATKDIGNTSALAAIKLEGREIAVGLPPTFLIWLEKQLNDLYTLLSCVPELDPKEKWSYDGEAALYKTEPAKTHRTKKTPRVIVKYEATPEHPAQTELLHEDKIIGHWRLTKHSSAIRHNEKKRILARVTELQKAVKMAREEANSIEVEWSKVGDGIVDYIFETEKS